MAKFVSMPFGAVLLDSRFTQMKRGVLFGILGCACTLTAAPLNLRSPGGDVTVELSLQGGVLSYQATYRGKPLVLHSRLSLSLYSGLFTLTGEKRGEHRGEWSPQYGERKTIPDRYNELTVQLRDTLTPHRPLEVVTRAYDEGFALRYRVGGEGTVLYASEFTEFHLPEGAYGYEEHGTEGEYARVRIADIKPGCERPLTVDYGNGLFASITDAANLDYPRMLLSPVKGRPGTLASDLSGSVQHAAPFETPWRVMIAGNRPGDLLERNYLVLNLNPPAVRAMPWVKPGKVMREVTLSTKGGKELVDFAVARGIDYIEYDAGWYGYEYAEESDATRVSPDPDRTRNIPQWGGLALQEVLDYARQKNVGVWLYVNRRALERQLAEILPLYRKWGVKGVKFGFVNAGPQEWTSWLHQAVAAAADNELMVDVHDGYRPTGTTRTFPNWLTQEGIRGNENMPTPRHNATLPFTRYIAGAGDYTICYYTPRIKTTRAHQMAMSVVAYSPLQFLFWYDKPSDYHGEPEVEFLADLPAVWDDTKVVDGQIGEYAALARKKGDDWFLGTINNETPRRLSLPLKFLDTGRKYKARIHENGAARTDVKTREMDVDSSTVLALELPADGGQAVHIRANPVRAVKE